MVDEKGFARLDQQIYDTYHSKKNKEALPTVIFLSCIVLIFNGAILFELIIWYFYYLYCKSNNDALNNSTSNLEKREFLLEYRRKLVNNEFKMNKKN